MLWMARRPPRRRRRLPEVLGVGPGAWVRQAGSRGRSQQGSSRVHAGPAAAPSRAAAFGCPAPRGVADPSRLTGRRLRSSASVGALDPGGTMDPHEGSTRGRCPGRPRPRRATREADPSGASQGGSGGARSKALGAEWIGLVARSLPGPARRASAGGRFPEPCSREKRPTDRPHPRRRPAEPTARMLPSEVLPLPPQQDLAASPARPARLSSSALDFGYAGRWLAQLARCGPEFSRGWPARPLGAALGARSRCWWLLRPGHSTRPTSGVTADARAATSDCSAHDPNLSEWSR